jgi:hypothetical protein
MPNGPIKMVGDSTVSVALHTDVVVDITVPGRASCASRRIPLRPNPACWAACCWTTRAWDRVGDLLTDSDFYRYEHRLIYAAIGG